MSLWSEIPGTKYLFYSLKHCFGLIANCCRPGLRCGENCPSFMYFWQIAAFAACFAFIPNCCPQRICQSIRWKVGWPHHSTLFKSRLVYFLPKMPTLNGQTTSVRINTLPQKYFVSESCLFDSQDYIVKSDVLFCWHSKTL